MTRLALTVLVGLAAACNAPTRSAAPAPKPTLSTLYARLRNVNDDLLAQTVDCYEEGMEALSRFMEAPDCAGADLQLVAERVAGLERFITYFDPAASSLKDGMLAYQTQARERHTSLAFALSDGALESGCLDAADQAYRRIISYYIGSAYAGLRDRAKLGIDDVRALRSAGQ